jgi:hypothetical protein
VIKSVKYILIVICSAVLVGLPLDLLKCQDMMRGPSKKKSGFDLRRDTVRDNWLLSVYRKYISPIDGDRCPMYPSCSQYTKEVFARHGNLAGFIMTTDRLTRCGNDLWNYRRIVHSGREYFIDIPY